MSVQELVCVNCPMGCRITVEQEGEKILRVEGYTCERGKAYAVQESIRPMRILTTTVRIRGAENRVLPVITEKEIPLDLFEQAMQEIRSIEIEAPVRVNQVIRTNLAGTDVSLVASRSMSKA